MQILSFDSRKNIVNTAKLFFVSAALLVYSTLSMALTSSDFSAVPPTLRGATPPLVMLAMSRDQQLYVKAYTDYSDLDGDGTLDTSYIDTFNYYGYFNSNLCYNYDGTNGYFVPVVAATGTNKHLCGTAAAGWSGNFLNWTSMTRMDVVRAVLYGGARVSGFDTATSGATQGITVIERVFLPSDNHAFVKVYSGADINKLTPYNPSSNKISLCNTSLATTGLPFLRIAEGSWQQWSSSEVVQCRYRDERDSGLSDQPSTTDRPSGLAADLTVRVQVCVSGVDAVSTNNRCKAYTNPSTGDITYKPVGILQQYGDDGKIRFGLLTGSYNAKAKGGVLRKDILPMTGNAVSSDNEIDTTNGRLINQGATDGGIINTLSRFRIVNYNFSGSYSDCNTYSIPISDFVSTSPPAGHECRSWGNPLTEIYLEALRYFAGASGPTTAFNVSDSSQIASLPQLNTWKNPLSASNACANCSLIVISTGLNSFDEDDLSSVTDLPGMASVASLQAKTNAVGTKEGIGIGGKYLIGRNGTTNDDDACTPKSLSNLADAKGVCPEVPDLQGGYDIAGLAYYAFTSDLRTSLSGIQKIHTYAVALSESLPSFEINANGKTVSFVPTCQANTTGGAVFSTSGWTDCSLVDVRVEQQTANAGSFLVAWEDSHWGNDYDMDGIARIEYCVGTNTASCPSTPANAPAVTTYNWKTSGLTANSVQFRISVPQANAGNALRFGYVISGVQSGSTVTPATNAAGVTGGTVSVTPDNGLQVHLLRQGGNTISRLSGSTSGTNIFYVEPVIYTASSTNTAGRLLENPLWYAAKYGNFNDINGNGVPDAGEWDVRNINGLTAAEGGGPDLIPDNYFPVRNPANLVTSLQQVLQRISASVASSTAAAVVANSSRGAGAIYQAIYYPQFQKKDTNGAITSTVDWVGELHALFIDDDGVVREDNGVKGQLEAITIDFGVEIYYDAVQNLTLVQRHNGFPFTTANRIGAAEPFEKLKAIWSARDNLAALTNTQLASQRNYTDATSTGRYIFTWIDRNKDGKVDNPATNSEIIDFVDTSFPISTSTPAPTPVNQNNYRYLGLPNANLTADVVNYIRGIDVVGGRSRAIDFDSSGTAKPWRLGDIIDSSPVIVGAPEADYDRRYGDTTYLAYKQQYENRRQVAYVGGNDGMLHAFNAGKWISSTKTFASASQPLGGELWAYVPSDLLPHLQWLKETNYPHVFYVDGALKSFDVNIFTADATHPGGWGTILVAGMRFGGGAFPLDTDGNGSNDTTMRSAYVVMDITDPESPPKLLAEITDPALGFTVGTPTVIKSRAPANGSFSTTTRNEWLLVLGSGPTALTTATSTQSSSVFAWSFSGQQLITLGSSVISGISESNSFLGSISVADWNNDFSDDAVYVGTVGGTNAAPTGKLKRIRLAAATNLGLNTAGSASAATFYDPARPILAAPSIYLDTTSGDDWVFFGTGRYLVPQDAQSTAQQAFYGLKEPKSSGALTYGTISTGVQDVTDVHVSTSGSVLGAGGSTLVIGGETISKFDDLRRKIAEGNGWVRTFSTPSGEGAERNFTESTFYYSSILFTTYQPDADLCSAAGDGSLYAISLFTGSAAPFQPVGVNSTSTYFTSVSQQEAAVSYDLGRTLPSQPVVTGDKAFIQGGHAEFIQPQLNSEGTPFGRQSWREIEINFGL